MTDTTHHSAISERVMQSIKEGRVHMRPRWQFILLSSLGIVGMITLILALLFFVSLVVFFMHESGVWFAPVFGFWGWAMLFRSIPILILGCLIVFVILLEMIVTHYSFGYRTPLLLSVAAIAFMVLGGGFAVAQTALHPTLKQYAHRNPLPPIIDDWYKHPARPAAIPNVVRGTVVEVATSSIVIQRADDEGTSSIEITPATRLPYGRAFNVDDEVMAIGDPMATHTMRAFGVHKIDRDHRTRRDHEKRTFSKDKDADNRDDTPSHRTSDTEQQGDEEDDSRD